MANDVIPLFMKIGLTEQRAKETAKNEALSQTLKEVILQVWTWILIEEIYVGGISAAKLYRNLLERRKTLFKSTGWCYSILHHYMCVINIAQRTGVTYAYLWINQMQSIIHDIKLQKAATSRLHCEKVRQLNSLFWMHSHEGFSVQL